MEQRGLKGRLRWTELYWAHMILTYWWVYLCVFLSSSAGRACGLILRNRLQQRCWDVQQLHYIARQKRALTILLVLKKKSSMFWVAYGERNVAWNCRLFIFFSFSFLSTFIGLTIVSKVTYVSGMQFCNTSSLYHVVGSLPKSVLLPYSWSFNKEFCP